MNFLKLIMLLGIFLMAISNVAWGSPDLDGLKRIQDFDEFCEKAKAIDISGLKEDEAKEFCSMIVDRKLQADSLNQFSIIPSNQYDLGKLSDLLNQFKIIPQGCFVAKDLGELRISSDLRLSGIEKATNLKHIDLRGATALLEGWAMGKDLSYSKLAGDLRNSGIEKAANLRGIDLTGATALPEGWAVGKDLGGAKLAGDLRNSGIEKATNLYGIDLTGATALPEGWAEMKNLQRAKLAGNLINSGIKKATHLQYIDLTGATALPDGWADEKDLFSAKLAGDLNKSGIEKGATFKEIDLTLVTSLPDGWATGKNLFRAKLAGDLSKSGIEKAISFHGIDLTLVTAFPDEWAKGKNLSYAKLAGDLSKSGIEKAENLNAVDFTNVTHFPPAFLLVALKLALFDIAKKLINENYDLNIKNENGESPLIVVANRDQKDILKMLIEKNATIPDDLEKLVRDKETVSYIKFLSKKDLLSKFFLIDGLETSYKDVNVKKSLDQILNDSTHFIVKEFLKDNSSMNLFELIKKFNGFSDKERIGQNFLETITLMNILDLENLESESLDEIKTYQKIAKDNPEFQAKKERSFFQEIADLPKDDAKRVLELLAQKPRAPFLTFLEFKKVFPSLENKDLLLISYLGNQQNLIKELLIKNIEKSGQDFLDFLKSADKWFISPKEIFSQIIAQAQTFDCKKDAVLQDLVALFQKEKLTWQEIAISLKTDFISDYCKGQARPIRTYQQPPPPPRKAHKQKIEDDVALFTHLYIANKMNRENPQDDSRKERQRELTSQLGVPFQIPQDIINQKITYMEKKVNPIAGVETVIYQRMRDAKGKEFNDKNRPALIYIHGDGAENKMTADRFDPILDYYLAQGYLVVSPNYRAGQEGKNVYDVAMAFKDNKDGIATKYNVNPDLIYTTSISAGSALLQRLLVEIGERKWTNPFRGCHISTAAGVVDNDRIQFFPKETSYLIVHGENDSYLNEIRNLCNQMEKLEFDVDCLFLKYGGHHLIAGTGTKGDPDFTDKTPPTDLRWVDLSNWPRRFIPFFDQMTLDADRPPTQPISYALLVALQKQSNPAEPIPPFTLNNASSHLKKMMDGFGIPKNNLSTTREIQIKKILAAESHYADKGIAYHGTNSGIVALTLLMSMIHSVEKNCKINPNIFRAEDDQSGSIPLDNFYQDLTDSIWQKKYNQNASSDDIAYNTDDEYTDQIMTLATTLFSGHTGSSSPLYFWNQNESVKKIDAKIPLLKILSRYPRLPKERFNLYQKLIEEQSGQINGGLFQMFFDEKVMDEITVIAESMGYHLQLKDETGKVIKPFQYQQILRNKPEKLQEIIAKNRYKNFYGGGTPKLNYPQIRMIALPKATQKVKVKLYPADPNQLADFVKKLKDLVKEDWQFFNDNPDCTLLNTPKLLRKFCKGGDPSSCPGRQ